MDYYLILVILLLTILLFTTKEQFTTPSLVLKHQWDLSNNILVLYDYLPYLYPGYNPYVRRKHGRGIPVYYNPHFDTSY